MVIAPKNFRDEEYFYTKDELVRAGHKVVVASLEDTAVSAVENKEVVVDLLLDECDVADYDAVVFVGGGGATCYFENEKAKEMAYQTFEQGKVIAGICVAPRILAEADVLDGKKATCWSSEKEILEDCGAEVVEGHVVVDENVVTADGPDASREFGRKISELLGVPAVDNNGNDNKNNKDIKEKKDCGNGECSVVKREESENKKNKKYYPLDDGECGCRKNGKGKCNEDSTVAEEEENDEGFPENQPYFGDEDKTFEKREIVDE